MEFHAIYHHPWPRLPTRCNDLVQAYRMGTACSVSCCNLSGLHTDWSKVMRQSLRASPRQQADPSTPGAIRTSSALWRKTSISSRSSRHKDVNQKARGGSRKIIEMFTHGPSQVVQPVTHNNAASAGTRPTAVHTFLCFRRANRRSHSTRLPAISCGRRNPAAAELPKS